MVANLNIKERRLSYIKLTTKYLRSLFIFMALLIAFPITGPIYTKAASPVVVINPGHLVGRDPGAVNGATGVQEATLTAQVSAKVVNKLKSQGYTVYLTHPVEGSSVPSLLTTAQARAAYDSNSSLKTITQKINELRPDLALSIHFNAGGKTASGYEFYWSSYRAGIDNSGVYTVSGLWNGELAYRDKTPNQAAQDSQKMASLLQQNYNGIGIQYRRTVERDDYIPAHTVSPSVLIEGGFVSNDAESRLLASAAFQTNMCDRTVTAINSFFGRSAATAAAAVKADTMTFSDVTSKGFKITLKGVANNVGGIGIPVWSEKNGQDDIVWYPAKEVSGGVYEVIVDTAKHKGDAGKYNAHAYASGSDGKHTCIKTGYVDVPTGASQKVAPTAASLIISNVTNSGFKATLNGLTGDFSGDVTFKAWSDKNGTDDVAVYTAKKINAGTYEVVVDIAKHKGDAGLYKVQSYVNDASGKSVLLKEATANVPAKGSTNPPGTDPDPFGYVKPTATSIVTSDVSKSGFKVTLKGLGGSHKGNVQFAVWSDRRGQDDLIWYRGTKLSNGDYEVAINTADHKRDTGTYHIHSYVYDSKGINTPLKNTVVTVPRTFSGTTTSSKYPSYVKPTASSVIVSDVTNEGFKITMNGLSGSHNGFVSFAVWTQNNNQDDLVWYCANKTSTGTYEAVVPTSRHKNETGIYNIHSYVYDKMGANINVDMTTVNVPEPVVDTYVKPTASNIEISNLTGDGFKVTIKDLVGSHNGYVQVPVWTEASGQDDLVWHRATKINGSTYEAVIKTSEHKNESGVYNVHSYVYDVKGNNTCLGTNTVSVQANTEVKPDNEPFALTTSILGASRTTKQQLVDYYNSKASFPNYYVQRGVNLDTFVQMYLDEAKAEGVRVEVAFAQMLHETGYLRFGGDVSISQFNFAGLGATGGGEPGFSFSNKYGDNANGIRMGIRGQIQHLKCYTSSPTLNNEVVDPRWGSWIHGRANTVGELAGNWATDKTYGTKLVNIMNAF